MIDIIESVPGLKYQESFLTPEQVRLTLNWINEQKWEDTKGKGVCQGCSTSRIVQQYGYKYNYLKRKVDYKDYLGPIPFTLDYLRLCMPLKEDGSQYKFDQVIINQYEPGQGIGAHIDCMPCFSDTIATISLYEDSYDEQYWMYSHGALTFTRKGQREDIKLPQGSLLIMTSEARTKWKHSYKNTSSIVRTSITFRKVTL